MPKPETAPTYLLVLPWAVEHPGGVNEVVLNLAEQLREGGAYTPLIAKASWALESGHSRFRGNQLLTLRLRSPYGRVRRVRHFINFLLTLLPDLWSLRRLIREHRVAVINFHFPDLNVVPAAILRWSGMFTGRFVLSFHGADIRGIASGDRVSRFLWSMIIRSADIVVACSNDLKREVADFCPQAKIRTIHNGVDYKLFHQRSVTRDVRKVILHIGKYEHKKAQDVLLLAFQRLATTRDDVTLILAGANGPTLDDTKKQISALGLDRRVELKVNVPHEQIPELMWRADLFVLPSRVEPFGIVLLEAGAAGLPVVAANVGGIPEIIEDGFSGRLVPVDDVGALESAMRAVLDDAGEAARLAQALQARVRTTWNWRRTCDQYLAEISRSASKRDL